jgi:tRNA threonylcarbamoyladenosine biosynthesis protein TsaE
MIPQEFIGYSQLTNLNEIAQQLLAYADKTRVWLFFGDLGAGKTTLIKAICAELGILGTVTSPTFALVHEYVLPTGSPVYHIDAYRIGPEQEATLIEVQSYIDTGHYCLVEWPTKLAQVFLPGHMAIQMVTEADGSRSIRAQLND